jgi:YD repeat-containing protein
MRSILAAFIVLLYLPAQSQYYYRDIIGTRETSDMMRTYMNNKVSRVLLTSFDADNTKSDNFYVQQEFHPNRGTLITTTRSGDGDPSILLSYIDAKGNVTRTVDSSISFKSTTIYRYNETGNLEYLQSNSTDSAGRSVQTEEHVWQYREGNISRMLRIKNKIDTSFIDFKKDDNGNIIEEQETRRGIKSEPVHYYYDRNNRLTDIVRFSRKANRLLPEYMFEYSASNQVIQKITVPSNSDKYLIWRYQYNAQGLKTKEAIYDKQKTLTGKVEYLYSMGN